jgi:uncharacterized membrane protein YhaH (DUF805 family)
MAVMAVAFGRPLPEVGAGRPIPTQVVDVLFVIYLALTLMAAAVASWVWHEMRACAWLVLVLLLPFVFVVYSFTSAATLATNG